MESTEKFHYDLINTTAEVGKWFFFSITLSLSYLPLDFNSTKKGK